MNEYWVYILSNYERKVLYIGVTNDIERRVWEHKSKKGSYFSSKYRCFYLMYMEKVNFIEQAINREKQLKNWRSKWKWDLVRSKNPELKDLAIEWYTGRP